MTNKSVIKGYEDYVILGFKPNHPISLVERKGSTVRDLERKEYIDCFPGIAVTNIGHYHPKVVEAIKRQAEKLIHSSFAYYNALILKLAKKLADKALERLKQSFIQNSGAEAFGGKLLFCLCMT